MGCGTSRPNEQRPPLTGATATVELDGKRPHSAKETSTVKADGTDPVSGTAIVKAWALGLGGSACFPEIDDLEYAIPTLTSVKVPLAICISGGGFRAATLALGWLRALHILGVLKKARYLCTCSGSSWLSAALSFQRAVPVGEFLGPHLTPEQCTLGALKEVGVQRRSAAAVLANAEPLREYLVDMASCLLEGPVERVRQARSWTKAIAAAFLQPFGLEDTDSSTTTCSGTQGGVHATVSERAAAVGRGNVYVADLDQLPFPIIVQMFLLPNERPKYYPLEWTPLYSGCPVRCSETSPKLGAGWVETLGLNAQPFGQQPEPAAGGPPGAVHIRVRPAGPASLGEAIGISSAYNAYKWALGKTGAGRSVHRALGFNTATYFNQQDWSCSSVQLADGGAFDYFALLPALRRRVPAIIVCSASRTRIEDPKFAFYMQELAGLFGCWPGDLGVDQDKDKKAKKKEKDGDLGVEEFNRMQQVFAPEGFPELHRALLDSATAGGPPVHVGEYTVLDNAALGIRGGWRVRVMWVVNDRQPQWEAALPAETRQRLQDDRTGLLAKVEEALNPLDADTLREFPHVSTFAMNYTPELVGLMSYHSGHMLLAAADAVRGMVAAAAEAAAGAEAAEK